MGHIRAVSPVRGIPMKEFNTLDDFNFRDRTVILRVDINCPLNKEDITLEDDNRIVQVLPTIRELLEKKAKVVIIAHQGRPGIGTIAHWTSTPKR